MFFVVDILVSYFFIIPSLTLLSSGQVGNPTFQMCPISADKVHK